MKDMRKYEVLWPSVDVSCPSEEGTYLTLVEKGSTKKKLIIQQTVYKKGRWCEGDWIKVLRWRLAYD